MSGLTTSDWAARNPWRVTGACSRRQHPASSRPDHYYLHADHVDSHDSRYAEIGPVPRERILGRAFALPALPWLGLEGPLVGPEPVGPESAERSPTGLEVHP